LIESNRWPDDDREVATAASRSTPLTIVSGAVAGDDLQRVARAAAEGIGQPVVIAFPAIGGTIVFPPEAIEPPHMREIVDYAVAIIRGEAGEKPAVIAYAVPIRIGLDAVGIVATANVQNGSALQPGSEEPRGWLEAAAAAAAVTALMHEARAGNAQESQRALLRAVGEAELLLELYGLAGASLSGQEETYRLLIGVLLRDPEELASLRARTISPLVAYDTKNDTELLATLETFLAHDGSTTETAEAMNLHRHTVGYRLTRVQEVSQLSPYESEGRERLSLGLKAHQILEAATRRARRL
jgi:PucR C-terminal helix-turn-helix domain